MTLIEQIFPALRREPEPPAAPAPLPSFSMNGGYKQGPAPAPRTAREISADHDRFVADLLTGAQFAPREGF